MPRRLPFVFALLALAVLTAAGTASARAQGSTSLPSLTDAHMIVTSLWNNRETALAAQDHSALAATETSSALAQDASYLRSVACGCEPVRQPTNLDRALPQIPKSAARPVFFAQVHVTAGLRQTPEWYVVAVASVGGRWKLAFVDRGGTAPAPPLQALTKSSGLTAAQTASVQSQLVRVARTSVRQALARTHRVQQMSWGGIDRNIFTLEPQKDGIYGLALPGGQVLSCFTVHSIDTYSMPGGTLQQGPQAQWGHQLAVGTYRSITSDTAMPLCATGSGAANGASVVRFQNDERTMSTTGSKA